MISLRKYIPNPRRIIITITKKTFAIFEGKVSPMKSVTKLKLHRVNKCPQTKPLKNLMKLQIITQKSRRCIQILFDFHRKSKTTEMKNKRTNRIIALPKMLITLSALFHTSSELAEVRALKSK
jgi:hypothetical protein